MYYLIYIISYTILYNNKISISTMRNKIKRIVRDIIYKVYPKKRSVDYNTLQELNKKGIGLYWFPFSFFYNGTINKENGREHAHREG